MKKAFVVMLILVGTLFPAQSRAEFHVYDNSSNFVGILVDTYADSSDNHQWILYVPKTKLYFRYKLWGMGSCAEIRKEMLYYTTDNCSGQAYVTSENFNTVVKLEDAGLFYTGGQERLYLNFKSYYDGSSCTDCSNNVMHFREAIAVPSNQVPLVSNYNLQWHLEYRRSGVAVIPLFD